MTMNAAYEVHLEIFEGPLDLLLYLIKKNDLQITDIPISQITQEYLSYLDLIRELNLEVAGDFLVMASTLMQIKSRSLLPSGPLEGEEDPRTELVQKLLEYAKFKEAAKFFEARAEEFKNTFYRGTPVFKEDDKTLQVELFDLLSALKDVIERLPEESRVLKGEEFPIELKIEKILNLLDERGTVMFHEVFADERRRMGVVVCFMALLELIKMQRIAARQERAMGPILIFKRLDARPTEESSEEAPPRDAVGERPPDVGAQGRSPEPVSPESDSAPQARLAPAPAIEPPAAPIEDRLVAEIGGPATEEPSEEVPPRGAVGERPTEEPSEEVPPRGAAGERPAGSPAEENHGDTEPWKNPS